MGVNFLYENKYLLLKHLFELNKIIMSGELVFYEHKGLIYLIEVLVQM